VAERVHVTCPACGSSRLLAIFGLAFDGDEVVALDEQPRYEPGVVVQTLGGRGHCRWERKLISRTVVKALRDRLREAAARLDRILNDEEDGAGDGAAAA